ncbi:uncharacterized protein LOC128954326 [Oppia nitens]|uniref:uncharacterized protein LOC128954326 n=1 Tax=Oppia nitens TaxID=1686743 RepID=UPI0023DB68A5|nr:uncharacterized protein LOC128954326 [Oppia nitens]
MALKSQLIIISSNFLLLMITTTILTNQLCCCLNGLTIATAADGDNELQIRSSVRSYSSSSSSSSNDDDISSGGQRPTQPITEQPAVMMIPATGFGQFVPQDHSGPDDTGVSVGVHQIQSKRNDTTVTVADNPLAPQPPVMTTGSGGSSSGGGVRPGDGCTVIGQTTCECVGQSVTEVPANLSRQLKKLCLGVTKHWMY